MQVNLLYYSAGLGLLVILTAGIAYFAFLRQYKNNTHESTNVTPFILENLRDAIIAVDG
ncbi:MAG: hypothetical protein Q8O48_05230 [Anaerolineales bacterium]|nr:hypothetical protein [Anaerolineales bacterium]